MVMSYRKGKRVISRLLPFLQDVSGYSHFHSSVFSFIHSFILNYLGAGLASCSRYPLASSSYNKEGFNRLGKGCNELGEPN